MVFREGYVQSQNTKTRQVQINFPICTKTINLKIKIVTHYKLAIRAHAKPACASNLIPKQTMKDNACMAAGSVFVRGVTGKGDKICRPPFQRQRNIGFISRRVSLLKRFWRWWMSSKPDDGRLCKEIFFSRFETWLGGRILRRICVTIELSSGRWKKYIQNGSERRTTRSVSVNRADSLNGVRTV